MNGISTDEIIMNTNCIDIVALLKKETIVGASFYK